MNPKDYISASELGEYVFCKRGWWLRRRGMLPITEEMVRGTHLHEGLFQKLLQLGVIRKLAIFCIGLGILLFVLIILFS